MKTSKIFQDVAIIISDDIGFEKVEICELWSNDTRTLLGYEAKKMLTEIPKDYNLFEYIYENYSRIQGNLLLKNI